MQKKQKKQKKIFIGVSWPYASGNIHIGHLAGQSVACDVFARYHRLKGNKVLMVSGSDSHGAAVELAANEKNISPEELAKKSHDEIKRTYEKLNFLYDNYTSTMTQNHKEVVQNVFLTLKEKGFLFIDKSMQYYDNSVERFLPDRFVKGTCPSCKNDNARGDECPECGEFLKPEDLIDPYSTLSDTTPILKETEHYYLDLAKNSKNLKSWVNDTGINWRKWVYTSTKGMIKVGLEPRPVTRDLKFGIPVPLDGWEEKRIYVWLEAVIGYLSASIEWSKNINNISSWEEFWKDPKCKHYYFIAGGNVPFHTIIWPSEILAYNEKYLNEEEFQKNLLPGETIKAPLNLPFDIPANKILMYKGKKISKGDGTGITLEHLLENYDPDLIRYFCVRYAPENHDREFVWEDLINANNNELVANLGNFINRVLTFTANKFDCEVPEGEIDEEVEAEINQAFKKTSKYLEGCQFIKAIESVLDLGHFANKYFNDQKPWEDIKSNSSSAKNSIYNSIQIVNALRILINPFLPETSKKLSKLLNLDNEYDPNTELKEKGEINEIINSWIFTNITIGHKLNTPEIVFTKLEYSDDLMKEDQQNVKDIAILEGKDVNVSIAEELNDIPVIWKSFNNLNIKRKAPKVKTWLKETNEKTRRKYDSQNWQEEDKFKKYVEIHKKYSQESNLIPSSVNLIQSIKEKGRLPNINTFVDIYNSVSALTGVSIGVHDISSIKGDIKLKILEKDIKFKTVSSKDEDIAKQGEYAYLDEEGIICRLDIKQSERTKVSSKTTDALVIMQGNENIQKEDLIKAMKLLEEGLELIGFKN